MACCVTKNCPYPLCLSCGGSPVAVIVVVSYLPLSCLCWRSRCRHNNLTHCCRVNIITLKSNFPPQACEIRLISASILTSCVLIACVQSVGSKFLESVNFLWKANVHIILSCNKEMCDSYITFFWYLLIIMKHSSALNCRLFFSSSFMLMTPTSVINKPWSWLINQHL